MSALARRLLLASCALADLTAYKAAKKGGDAEAADSALDRFKENQDYLGYGYLAKPEDAVPPVQTTFYAFHIMVFLSVFFGLICIAYLVYGVKDTIEQKRWLLPLGVLSFFLAMIASQAGWIVAEVGRQPWAIQDMLPVGVATSNIGERQCDNDILDVCRPLHPVAAGGDKNHAQTDKNRTGG